MKKNGVKEKLLPLPPNKTILHERKPKEMTMIDEEASGEKVMKKMWLPQRLKVSNNLGVQQFTIESRVDDLVKVETNKFRGHSRRNMKSLVKDTIEGPYKNHQRKGHGAIWYRNE